MNRNRNQSSWNTLRPVAMVALFIVPMLGSLSFAAPKTFEYRGGQWIETNAPTSRPATDPTLDRVEGMLHDNQPKAARQLLLWWIKTYPTHPLRDRGVFLLGKIYFELDDRILAFYHMDEVMDTWPESAFFQPALALQYRIADEYLSGHKDTFIGIRMVERVDIAIEMMFRIQERSPGSPLAEKALLRTADFYFADSQFDLSYDAYSSYVRSYGRSPFAPRARLRAAVSSLAQFRATKFDATPLLDARSQLVDIINTEHQLAAEENLTEWVTKIDQTLAGKLLDTAAYYRRVHQPASAIYTLRQAVEKYPQTPQADVARKQLAELEKK